MTTIFDIPTLAGATERRFAHADERRALSLQRDYAFPAAEVWSAWTEPERLARWLGRLSGERAIGATLQLRLSPDAAAAADVATVTVLACEAPTRLIVRWEWPDEPDSFVDLRIESIGDRHSRLHLEHVGLVEQTGIEYGAGWDDFLLRAALFLGGDDPADLPAIDVKASVDPAWSALAAHRSIDSRWPTVSSAGGEHAVLRTERVIHRPVEQVWAALTTQESISDWFGATTGDLTLGGRFAVSFEGGGATGSVRSCDPDRSFVVSWIWDHDGVETEVRVTLDPCAAGTIVRIEQSGVVGPATGYAAGWAAYLSAAERWFGGSARSEDLWQAEWTLAKAMTSAP